MRSNLLRRFVLSLTVILIPFLALAAITIDQPPTNDISNADLKLTVDARLAATHMEEKGWIFRNEGAENYFSGLLSKFGSLHASNRNVKLQARVMSDSGVFNLTLPDGTILLSSGIFPLIENEDQLVFLMATQAAHIHYRDLMMEEMKVRQKNAAILAANIALSVATGYATSTGVLIPVGSSSRLIVFLHPFAMQEPGMQTALNVSIKGYSGDCDRRADIFALNAMERLGYDPKQAVIFLKKLEQLPPPPKDSTPPYLTNPAVLKKRIAEVETAVGQLSPAASSGPNRNPQFLAHTAVAKNNAGMLLLKEEQYDAAEKIFGQLKLEFPQDPQYPYQIGEAYRLRAAGKPSPEDQAKALEEYQIALKLDPNYLEAHLGLGLLHKDMGATPEAIKELEFYVQNCKSAFKRAKAEAALKQLKGPQPQ